MKNDQLKSAENKIHFSKTNYVLLFLSIFFIALGFYFLAQPPVDGFLTMNVAPIILILTYCILIPFTLLYHKTN